MKRFTPQSAIRNPKSTRRGGTYIIVIGSALIVSTLGMMALLQQRIQRRGFEAAANMEQARLNAESAVRLGLLKVARDPNWRSVAAGNSGKLISLTSTEFGDVEVDAIDPHDADLIDDDSEPVILRSRADVGETTQYADRLVHPDRDPPAPLVKGVVAGDDISANSADVYSERPLSCDASVLASSNLYADVESVSTSGGAYYGDQTVVLDEDRPQLPDIDALVAEYTGRGTAINIGSLPPNTPNLIRNPGIEQGQGDDQPADHWVGAPNPPESESCDVEQNTGKSNNGAASLFVKNRTGHSAGPVQYCADWIKPDTTYYLEAWIHSDDLLGLTEFRFSWYANGTVSAQQWQGAGSLLLDLFDLGEWKKLSGTITTTPWSGDLISSYIKIESQGLFGPPDFYVDDVIVQESNARFLYRQVISPNSNPFGATNSEGIYVVDCVGSRLIVERSRILGTLVILNPGAGSQIAGPVSWEPARLGYPALIVGSTNPSYPANLKIATNRRGLSESLNSTNYNPAGTPHDAVGTDADSNDILPSEIRGWMYAGNTLTFDNGPSVHGVVMAGEDVHFNGRTRIFWDPAPIHHAPPGMEGTLKLKAREGASKKAVQ